MLVIAIDVGGPKKIGWASSDGRSGSGRDVETVPAVAARALNSGRPVALGFESPIWTPRRDALSRITSRRSGLFVWKPSSPGPRKRAPIRTTPPRSERLFLRPLDAPSDVPGEAAVNLAVASLLATGWHVAVEEISRPLHVVAAGAVDSPQGCAE
jgi:hypothetical protein